MILLFPLLALPRAQFGHAVAHNNPESSVWRGNLYAHEDSFVREMDPDTNFGGLPGLWVSNFTLPYHTDQEQVYIKFDLSDIPPEATILAASLSLYCYHVDGYPIDVEAHYCPDNSWTEMGITWNNKPSYDTWPTDTQFVYAWNRWYSWEVSPLDVQEALSSGYLTEVMTCAPPPPPYTRVKFFSRSWEDFKPTLSICYELPEVLYLVVRGNDDRVWYRQWVGPWTALTGATTDSPAAAILHAENNLHIVVKGTTVAMWHGYVDLSTSIWSGWTMVPGATPSSPTLTASFTKLYMVIRGMDDSIYYNSWTSATGWEGWTALPGATCDRPGAAILENKLHIVVRGLDGISLWHGYVSLSTSSFSGWSLLSGATPSAPTLTASATKLYLVVRGNDDRIYHNSWNGTSWQSWSALPTGRTPDSPATAVLVDNLHIVVRGMDGTSLWHGYIDLSTHSFSGWSLLTGATPSAPELTA